jgi:NADPH-dependent curcumin reductase CurA
MPAYTEYSGVPGFLETVGVLVASGSAAWVGIRTGMREKQNKTLKAAGWIGGVGSVVLGLLYLGQKSGVGQRIGLPAVRVTT